MKKEKLNTEKSFTKQYANQAQSTYAHLFWNSYADCCLLSQSIKMCSFHK